jgi:hypothetical protein
METLTLDSLLNLIETLPVTEQEILLQTQQNPITTKPRIPGQEKGHVIIAPDLLRRTHKS